jgi:hypothetical protein
VKKIPAILHCVAETNGAKIAGLSLLDRLIVTAHRAGCAPIYLIAKTTPSVPRAHALVTNRDFSLLVLVLAIAGKLDLFLWMAGIGVHLFWIIALHSQWRDTRRAPAISESA